MTNKNLLSQYFEKNKINRGGYTALVAARNHKNPRRVTYQVNSLLDLDLLEFLLDNRVYVNKNIAGRVVAKECIPLSSILTIPITEPSILSKRKYIRLLKTSDPIPKLRSMYIDEAYWFLNYIFNYLKYKQTLTHSDVVKMLNKAMERAHE